MRMYKIIFYILSIFSLFVNVRCEGELIILHAPKSLKFDGRPNAGLPLSKLKDVFSMCLGYTVEEGYDWPGLKIQGIPTFAQALFVFSMAGENSFGSIEGERFPLIYDENVDDTYEMISLRTKQRFPEQNPVLMKAVLSDDKTQLFDGSRDSKEIKLDLNLNNISPVLSSNDLSPDIEVNNKFIQEIDDVVIKLLERKNKHGIPGIYWISLENVTRFHGYDFYSSSEVNKLLVNTMLASTEKFKKEYKDNVLVAAMINEEMKYDQRFKRETPIAAPVLTLELLNVADDYDENFPVIFNIVLWSSLVLLFSVIAICMVIANMDPGRDSIIYRMTSTRMKKDN